MWRHNKVKYMEEETANVLIKNLADKITQFRSDLEALNRILKEQDIAISKEIDLLKREVGDIIFKFKNDVNFRLLDIKEEIAKDVADKYFKTLEDIFRWNREFSFLEKFANGNGKTLETLRRSIMQPFLEHKWQVRDKELAGQIDNTIKSKGELILQKRRELEAERIKLQREEKDTKEIDVQLRVFSFLLGDIR